MSANDDNCYCNPEYTEWLEFLFDKGKTLNASGLTVNIFQLEHNGAESG